VSQCPTALLWGRLFDIRNPNDKKYKELVPSPCADVVINSMKDLVAAIRGQLK